MGNINSRVTVVAEIGWNFMGNLLLAEEMIRAAQRAGADICKFQYWDPACLKPGLWDSDGRRDIYQDAKLDEGKISTLSSICSEVGVGFLLSVFSLKGAEFIQSIGQTAIKIPSHEAYNTPLYEYAVENFSTVYASLGACTEQELDAVARVYEGRSKGVQKFNAMHCVSAYPCAVDHLNLNRIQALQERFDEVGFSDHSASLVSGAVAVGIGCRVVEKHFTTDNQLPGRDNQFALTEEKFRQFVDNIREATAMKIDRGVSYQEIEHDVVENYRGRWALGES